MFTPSTTLANRTPSRRYHTKINVFIFMSLLKAESDSLAIYEFLVLCAFCSLSLRQTHIHFFSLLYWWESGKNNNMIFYVISFSLTHSRLKAEMSAAKDISSHFYTLEHSCRHAKWKRIFWNYQRIIFGLMKLFNNLNSTKNKYISKLK